jgi:deoxyribodipyrimidine photo-lyase
MSIHLWWIRKDIRLIDNLTLQLARANNAQIIPVFILDPQLIKSPTPRRQDFLFNALNNLSKELSNLGSRLIIRSGTPLIALTNLYTETRAEAIFAEEDYTPYARKRDTEIGKTLPLKLVQAAVIHHPADLLNRQQNPFRVFTAYNKAWQALPFPFRQTINAPERLIEPIPSLPSEPLPQFISNPYFPAAEKEAQKRLVQFLDNPIYDYDEKRNLPADDETSRLSPYIRFGLISPQVIHNRLTQAVDKAPNKTAKDSCQIWKNELVWREFFTGILYHFPAAQHHAFRTRYQTLNWRFEPEAFEAWKTGKTGFPLVDAGMRQLIETGWMHNRTRMVTASFLVKDLLINWQAGEAWFMQQLVDGDPAVNNGNWQWSAGVGTDAAPYFRIFNPTSQAEKHDPQGEYIRRWVPELTHVPDKYIHAPWQMPKEIQSAAGCVIGKDYPAPIIDHKAAKERTLAFYKSV